MTDGTTNPETSERQACDGANCTCAEGVAEAIIAPSLLTDRQSRRVEAAYVARDLLLGESSTSGGIFSTSSSNAKLLSKSENLVPDILVLADWILGDSITVHTADGSVALEIEE